MSSEQTEHATAKPFCEFSFCLDSKLPSLSMHSMEMAYMELSKQ
jgi:hypothetical protein